VRTDPKINAAINAVFGSLLVGKTEAKGTKIRFNRPASNSEEEAD
jgi:hypothetical protein